MSRFPVCLSDIPSSPRSRLRPNFQSVSRVMLRKVPTASFLPQVTPEPISASHPCFRYRSLLPLVKCIYVPSTFFPASRRGITIHPTAIMVFSDSSGTHQPALWHRLRVICAHGVLRLGYFASQAQPWWRVTLCILFFRSLHPLLPA